MAIPVLESLPAPLALCGSSLITKRVVSIFPRLEIKLALKKNKKLAPPLICSLWSEILSINTGNGCAELTLNQLSRLHTCWCGDWINPNVALRDTRRQRLSQACPRLVRSRDPLSVSWTTKLWGSGPGSPDTRITQHAAATHHDILILHYNGVTHYICCLSSHAWTPLVFVLKWGKFDTRSHRVLF